jgi:hypothetical protein
MYFKLPAIWQEIFHLGLRRKYCSVHILLCGIHTTDVIQQEAFNVQKDILRIPRMRLILLEFAGNVKNGKKSVQLVVVVFYLKKNN